VHHRCDTRVCHIATGLALPQRDRINQGKRILSHCL
jgi:hypothetical protein